MTTPQASVTARAQRCDGWWAIEVPEIPGLFTQTRRLDQIPGMVKDAAALLGERVETVRVEPILGEEDERLVQEMLEAKHTASQAQAKASQLSGRTVRALKTQGLTVRDIASIMGITPQRVSAIAR